MPSEQPHRQADVEYVILEALAHGRIMTTQEIYGAVRRKLDLAPADLERANKRANEHKVDQITANALQDGRKLCKEGLIERVARGEFQITQLGQAELTRLEEFKAMLSALMSGEEGA